MKSHIAIDVWQCCQIFHGPNISPFKTVGRDETKIDYFDPAKNVLIERSLDVAIALMMMIIHADGELQLLLIALAYRLSGAGGELPVVVDVPDKMVFIEQA